MQSGVFSSFVFQMTRHPLRGDEDRAAFDEAGASYDAFNADTNDYSTVSAGTGSAISGAQHLAKGGLAAFSDHLNSMGFGTVEIPHLAIGGLPEYPSAEIGENTLSGSSSRGDGAPTQHHTVDLRTNHGTFRLMSPEETVGQLKKAAMTAKRNSTGNKPSWYGGG